MENADEAHKAKLDAQRSTLLADFELQKAAAKDAFQKRLDQRCSELEAEHEAQLLEVMQDNSLQTRS